MMHSGSWASLQAAAPPEMFGEPDERAEPTRWHCARCGGFLADRPTRSERRESFFGAVVAVDEWDCRKCGKVGLSMSAAVGKVYGPLPPWSEPWMVRGEDGEWYDAQAREMAEEAAAWAQSRARATVPT